MKYLTFISFALLLTALPTEAFASSGGALEPELWVTLMNFAAFSALIIYLYRKKVSPALTERSVDVRDALNRVFIEEKRIEEEIAILREALETVEDEEQAVIESFREEGVRSAEAIRQAMLKEVQQIEKDTEQMKENLLNQLEAELREEMTARAIKRASEKLSQMFTPEMDRNLRQHVLRSFVE